MDINPIDVEVNGIRFTTQKSLMHPDHVYHWLSTHSYWSKYMPREVFDRAFENSFCIGALDGDQQIGFARLVTDFATYGYLADVFVLDAYRGQGISKVMMELLFEQEWVKQLRRLMLATKDAHTLYEKVGFHAPNFPDRLMEIARPNLYGDMETKC